MFRTQLKNNGGLIVALIRSFVDWIVDTIFSFIYTESPRKHLPPLDEPFLMESAVSVSEKIRKKQVSVYMLN